MHKDLQYASECGLWAKLSQPSISQQEQLYMHSHRHHKHLDIFNSGICSSEETKLEQEDD